MLESPVLLEEYTYLEKISEHVRRIPFFFMLIPNAFSMFIYMFSFYNNRF
ncbi:hypothetical protein Lalb_Chr20g0115281 [Lupinus albus]|uniref:Uncharacterized protein n=1 Tax=Lupinus albus TaxID=3870 RepID=A0A6A4NPL9_LUPAL|nr:hypothetical protein Lalb_Chr20g0115281 [Lupinus albus]